MQQADVAHGRRHRSAQRGSANGQRGAKRQPAGTLPGSGTVPGMAASRRRGPVERRQGGQQALRVGMARGAEQVLAPGASSTSRPAYITATRLTFSATTPRSWLISTSAMPVSRRMLASKRQDLRLDGGVERRGRLVGDQQVGLAGQRHGDHDALVQPAGELVRIVAEPARGVGDADLVEQAQRLGLGGRAIEAAMQRRAPRRAASRCDAPD